MKHKDFDYIHVKYAEIVSKKLTTKSKEYSRNDDKFHNFKVAGRKLNVTPEEALRGMKIKHDVSIDDIIDDINNGILWPDKIAEEKITDDIAYLFLLAGLIVERRRNEKKGG